MLIENHLNAIREIQTITPNIHIGGSFGLYLYGFDLDRNLETSDFDLITDNVDWFVSGKFLNNEYCFKDFVYKDGTLTPAYSSDFKYRFSICLNAGVDVFVDVCRDLQNYNIIDYFGHKYKVSALSSILYYKMLYANRGVHKHKQDLVLVKEQMKLR